MKEEARNFGEREGKWGRKNERQRKRGTSSVKEID